MSCVAVVKGQAAKLLSPCGWVYAKAHHPRLACPQKVGSAEDHCGSGPSDRNTKGFAAQPSKAPFVKVTYTVQGVVVISCWCLDVPRAP